jgi:hypothetical protein
MLIRSKRVINHTSFCCLSISLILISRASALACLRAANLASAWKQQKRHKEINELSYFNIFFVL